MATLRDIKKRIGTVKNTQKITKAMKMVAAAKLRRAQMAVIGSRPFAGKLEQVVRDIAAKSSSAKGKVNPLFVARDQKKKVELLVFTSNRGLCGGFNSNLLRQTGAFLKDLRAKNLDVCLNVVGKKGREFFTARQIKIDNQYIPWAEKFPYEEANQYMADVVQRFLAGEIDEFYIVYNKFVSAIKQDITFQKLLPLDLPQGDVSHGLDFIYEPSRRELLDTLLPKYLATQVFKAHLESLASELGSRMSAMDSATNNAVDMIGKLTLKYNRARQSAITTELMDIVNGAESLKG
jgi:F-type H+-transporting ATPase subunit gamma